uniref:Small ribosomal subunit protein uS3c n=1 Tax=Pleurostichidium falkenbergii TaxID=121064 RepID=A0A4D6UYW5_9FLOR|nr:ribosomal protein S3 [Pleurostichidium falkenbergii]QCH39700.1 ribosomal protein S3 [Pleurostichidium falkenbergii]
MGQKTHPLGFRIGITESHRSSWFSKMNLYPVLIEEDYKIRSYIEHRLKRANIARVQIDRKLDQTEITIHTGRPGIILGRSGSGIDIIREQITNTVKASKKVRINVVEVAEPDRQAILLGQWIAQQLEKRVAFRRAVRQGVQKSQKANINGIKVQISGRLNGAEIARKEWIREGRVPLQTLRANIDYAYTRAYTTYGILGIKIWLFKDDNIKV